MGKVKVKSLSRVWLFATPWTVAHQAPLSMGFSRQEYCSGLPFPSPGDLPDPGIEPWSPAFQADSSPSEPPGKPSLISKYTTIIIIIKMVWYENKRYTHRPMGQNWEPRNKHIQRELKVKVKVKSLSHVRLFATPWTVAYQAPPSMGFSRQEYWSGLSFPSPRDLPDPGIKPGSPEFQANALTSEPPGKLQIMGLQRVGHDWATELTDWLTDWLNS